MIGFETIGNATVICHDGDPVLATDPWLDGGAYFGSWGLDYAVPSEQQEAIARCRYVWLSHGHPDHLNAGSLDRLAGTRILLPDHVGGRIRNDLEALGFSVQVLADRQWTQLSERIRVMCVSDYHQDAVLLVDVAGRLLVDVNDAVERGWGRFVRSVIRQFDETFLLKLFGYGDADMINVFDEAGRRLLAAPPADDPAFWQGYFQEKVQFWARYFGTRYLIPFSCFHRYQRLDSSWATAYTTPLAAYDALRIEGCEVLPAFVRYDCETSALTRLDPPKEVGPLLEPSAFGDDWSQPLDAADGRAVTDYFRSIEFLRGKVDEIRFDVGGTPLLVPIGRGAGRGLTFHVPRTSLMSAVEWRVFDDLLIGNFMKTTLHGDWGTAQAPNVLYPHFTPFVVRYADNAGLKKASDLKAYFRQYARRAPIAHLLHRFEHGGVQRLRGLIKPGSRLFRTATTVYSFFKR